MRRAGVTVVEMLIAATLMAMVLGGTLLAFNMLGKQAQHASVGLSQMQEALLLLETVRLELASIVMNPLNDPADHEGNSFVISKPNGSSIQFVTERDEAGFRQRYLVYYEATYTNGKDTAAGLSLRKTTWKFMRQSPPWTDTIEFPPGWPAAWIGPQVEREEARFRELALSDIQWQYQVPEEGEGRVFFRLKLLMRGPSPDRPLPLTTLVSVQTPDLPSTITACPSLFASCFDPAKPNCYCTPGGKGP